MKIEEVNETIKAYKACRFEHACCACPISKIAQYGDCCDILDDQVIAALERLEYLETRLQATKEFDIENTESTLERFIIKDETMMETRVNNTLRRNGITSIKQFAETDPKKFMWMRNVGRKALSLIKDRHIEARMLLGLSPMEFNEEDITFILHAKSHDYSENYRNVYLAHYK